jgi:tRNA-specific 2-thiouridylase
MFPVGDSSKAQIRAEAAVRRLAVADKPDSHDICFIADGDTRAFLSARLGRRPGVVVDAGSGEVVGTHAGTHGFTVGQRRGLGLDPSRADGTPRYVLAIRPATNTVVVGPADRLDVDEIEATDPVWSGGSVVDGSQCWVQVRAHGDVSPATISVSGAQIVARLHTPQRGVAAGQALVCYDGDTVLGSATISATRRACQPA